MTIEDILARAVITFSAAFGLWVLKELFQGVMRWRDAKQRRDNLVRALYAEIDFNTRDMEVFLTRSPSEEQLRTRMAANPALVPHITDARHTEIYRTRIGELHGVTDPVLSKMVHFYGMLEKIKVQIDGVNYPSYLTLSVDGRMNGVMVIVRTAQLAKKFGTELLADMERDFPQLNLSRFDRGEGEIGVQVSEVTHDVPEAAPDDTPK